MRLLITTLLIVISTIIPQTSHAWDRSKAITDRDSVFKNCELDPLENAYRDCTCYADEYERLFLKNLMKHPDFIELEIRTMCYDTKEVYVYEYKTCLDKVEASQDDFPEDDPEVVKEMCACHADYMKEKLEDYIDRKHKRDAFPVKQIRISAYKYCQRKTGFGHTKIY